MRRPREHETSVKARLIDLLDTYPGRWFSIKDLVEEYSERFGPVKVDTIRQAVFRELGRDDGDCAMFVRYKSTWMTAGIEVCWRYPALEEAEI